MLGKIASFVVAFVVLVTTYGLIIPATSVLSITLKKAKRPAVIGLLTGVEMCLAVMVAAWLIRVIGQSPAWLMFLVPAYFIFQNDVVRVRRVKKGGGNVKLMLERRDDSESYNQILDLRVAQAHLVGDVIGWIVGTNIALHSAGFF